MLFTFGPNRFKHLFDEIHFLMTSNDKICVKNKFRSRQIFFCILLLKLIIPIANKRVHYGTYSLLLANSYYISIVFAYLLQ